MVNETLMYQSLLLLGMIAFGAFSVTFTNFDNRAQSQVMQSNLTKTLNDVGRTINQLVAQGEKLKGDSLNGGSIVLTVYLELAKEFGKNQYVLNSTVDSTDGSAVLVGTQAGSTQIVSSYDLGFSASTIQLNGFLYSSANAPYVKYVWNGITTQVVLGYNK